MKFSEETLMAYADRQLDAETIAAVEAAMAADPELARRVERQAVLAENIRAAFDPVLAEPVPPRLLDVAAAAEKAPTSVIDLAQRREARQVRPPRRWSWPQWGAIAASLVVGVMAGRSGIERAPFATVDGHMLARGALERALATQLANAQADDAPVRLGISFKTQAGEYCRTFAFAQGPAGMACKFDENWRVQMLAQPAPAESSGAYRMAGSGTPAVVMREVDATIAGSPLDAAAEIKARQRAWRK